MKVEIEQWHCYGCCCLYNKPTYEEGFHADGRPAGVYYCKKCRGPMKTALEILANVPEGSFESGYKYYLNADFLTYFISDKECIAEQYGDLTVFKTEDGEITGIKLDNISKANI